MPCRPTVRFLSRCMECRRGPSDENSVCLYVCLSVKRVHCDKMEERSVQIFIPYERSFSLVFWEEEWLVGRPLLPEILGQPAPVGAKSPILKGIFARSASAVTVSEKNSFNTNRKFTMRFPVSLRWSSYVAPKLPKGGSKRKTTVCGVKSHFAWRKSATKFLCVKTVSDKVVRHSLA